MHSQALVALTLELDGEFERRMPHRTTVGGGRGPWLVSVAMHLNCLRWVDEDGATPEELLRRARTKTNLAGMVRSLPECLPILGHGLWTRWKPVPGGERTEADSPITQLRGLATSTTEARRRIVQLTPAGLRARDAALRRLAELDAPGFESLPTTPPAAHPGSWRAALPEPATLPHFPVVLHRGGYPDGS